MGFGFLILGLRFSGRCELPVPCVAPSRAITGPGTSSTGGATSSTATAGQIAAARMREIPTPATPTPATPATPTSATPLEAASAVPLASAATATTAAAPVEPSADGANSDAGRPGRGGGLEIPQVPEDWVAPECPTYLALDTPGPNHDCPICGYTTMRWEAQTMPTGFMKPWLRCRHYPCCPFAYSPRRGVLNPTKAQPLSFSEGHFQGLVVLLDLRVLGALRI